MNLEKLNVKNSNKIITRLSVFMIMISLYCSNALYVAAGTNYGENIGKWALDQLFWIAVVVSAFVLLTQAVRRSTTGIISTIIVGALVCFFIKNPTKFETIGNQFGKIIGF